MRKPYTINNDGEFKTLQDCIEQLALGIADDVANGEKVERIQSECKILDSLTNALLAIKNSVALADSDLIMLVNSS